MSAYPITEPQRIRLTLDPGLVLERLILKRLAELTRQRGHDWLRSLLVQGFLTEGRWLRAERKETGEGQACPTAGIPATSFGRWLEGAHRPPERPKAIAVQPMASANPRVAPPSSGEKPFAHLRKVVG